MDEAAIAGLVAEWLRSQGLEATHASLVGEGKHLLKFSSARSRVPSVDVPSELQPDFQGQSGNSLLARLLTGYLAEKRKARQENHSDARHDFIMAAGNGGHQLWEMMKAVVGGDSGGRAPATTTTTTTTTTTAATSRPDLPKAQQQTVVRAGGKPSKRKSAAPKRVIGSSLIIGGSGSDGMNELSNVTGGEENGVSGSGQFVNRLVSSEFPGRLADSINRVMAGEEFNFAGFDLGGTGEEHEQHVGPAAGGATGRHQQEDGAAHVVADLATDAMAMQLLELGSRSGIEDESRPEWSIPAVEVSSKPAGPSRGVVRPSRTTVKTESPTARITSSGKDRKGKGPALPSKIIMTKAAEKGNRKIRSTLGKKRVGVSVWTIENPGAGYVVVGEKSKGKADSATGGVGRRMMGKTAASRSFGAKRTREGSSSSVRGRGAGRGRGGGGGGGREGEATARAKRARHRQTLAEEAERLENQIRVLERTANLERRFQGDGSTGGGPRSTGQLSQALAETMSEGDRELFRASGSSRDDEQQNTSRSDHGKSSRRHVGGAAGVGRRGRGGQGRDGNTSDSRAGSRGGDGGQAALDSGDFDQTVLGGFDESVLV